MTRLFHQLCLVLSMSCVASALPKLKLSENRRFLVTESGEPFFWLGDTATADQIRELNDASQLVAVPDQTKVQSAAGHTAVSFTLARQGVTFLSWNGPEDHRKSKDVNTSADNL